MVYEKLDKIRGDLAKAREKRDEAEAKVKQLEQRLKDAESKQILTDVGNFNLSPEQVAEFLQFMAKGQLPQTNPTGVSSVIGSTYSVKNETSYGNTNNDEDKESEDFENEDDQ